MILLNDRMLNTREVAEILQVNPGTLAKWRMDGRYGLPVIRVGRAVRYRRSDVEAWLQARTDGKIEG